jgi:hypothetical protein
MCCIVAKKEVDNTFAEHVSGISAMTKTYRYEITTELSAQQVEYGNEGTH